MTTKKVVYALRTEKGGRIRFYATRPRRVSARETHQEWTGTRYIAKTSTVSRIAGKQVGNACDINEAVGFTLAACRVYKITIEGVARRIRA